jgi:hypothetical protein
LALSTEVCVLAAIIAKFEMLWEAEIKVVFLIPKLDIGRAAHLACLPSVVIRYDDKRTCVFTVSNLLLPALYSVSIGGSYPDDNAD